MTTPVRFLLATFLTLAATASWCTPVNVNTADATTIAASLSGIGPTKAQAIVDYRQKHGPFRSVDELTQVKGISQKLINRNRADLHVTAATTTVAAGAAHPSGRPTSQPASQPSAQPASHN
jgi:competence protein ComEA